MTRATSYRFTPVSMEGTPRKVRVAVEVWLKNHTDSPWKAAKATLVGAGGEPVAVREPWQPALLHPGPQPARVAVEAELTPEEARGTFSLTLSEEDGARRAHLPGVTFP
jgi:hypothetical protein